MLYLFDATRRGPAHRCILPRRGACAARAANHARRPRRRARRVRRKRSPEPRAPRTAGREDREERSPSRDDHHARRPRRQGRARARRCRRRGRCRSRPAATLLARLAARDRVPPRRASARRSTARRSLAFCEEHGVPGVVAKKKSAPYATDPKKAAWFFVPTGSTPRSRPRVDHRAVDARAVLRRVTYEPREGLLAREGYTKGDLCDYYASVADVILPYLADRPVILVRYPDGIAGKSFYQWNVPPGMPPWVRTLSMKDEESGEHEARLPARRCLDAPLRREPRVHPAAHPRRAGCRSSGARNSSPSTST